MRSGWITVRALVDYGETNTDDGTGHFSWGGEGSATLEEVANPSLITSKSSTGRSGPAITLWR